VLLSSVGVKRKIISAAVYAATSFALAGFFDGLYGAGPVTRYLGVIHLAIAGTILFAVACVLSLFTLRVGVICGLCACVLSWPYFAIQIPTIPWNRVFAVLHYANWQDLMTAILALVVSSAYSVNRLRLLLRGSIDSKDSRIRLKLAAALFYTAVIMGEATWRGVSDWLFRLRYGS
jgi:hypothetical protein